MPLANYSVAYEETQSNRVSEFREFVCSLFLKAILFYFYFSYIYDMTSYPLLSKFSFNVENVLN